MMNQTQSQFQVMKQRQSNTKYHAYKETEQFVSQGKPVASVLDYWRLCYSQLLMQTGTIGEFLVYTALGLDKAENVDYWTAYDLSYHGVRIEVKATSYVHPWNKKKVSRIRSFSIAPSHNEYWGKSGEKALERQSDLYVFCMNTNQTIEKADPLNVDDWVFYVVPTATINRYCEKRGKPNQKTIQLQVVSHLAGRELSFHELKPAIDAMLEAYNSKQ